MTSRVDVQTQQSLSDRDVSSEVTTIFHGVEFVFGRSKTGLDLLDNKTIVVRIIEVHMNPEYLEKPEVLTLLHIIVQNDRTPKLRAEITRIDKLRESVL